jgi:phosphopantothenoylcysteine decarboxylase/phosphopantothenate--cysteine ligase
MNDEMWAATPTQRNVALLRERGFSLVGPESGALAEGPSDRPGRMSEPEVIQRHAARLLRGGGPLAGKRVVVTAGPTRETLDPVRLVTNRSSGKMGFRLAEAAWTRGAEVRLISGPSREPVPTGVTLERIETTAELERAVGNALPWADVLIMAAAPSDYRPLAPLAEKLPRENGRVSVELEATPDILLATRDRRKPGSLMVGFALETGDAEARGRAKLERKQLDLVVVNGAQEPDAGFEVDTNRVLVLDRKGGRFPIPFGSKAAVAEGILDRVEAWLD